MARQVTGVAPQAGGTHQSDRREQLRSAAAKVRRSMSPEFRTLSADSIMAFLRADDPPKLARRCKS
jgi:hypothetical protein